MIPEDIQDAKDNGWVIQEGVTYTQTRYMHKGLTKAWVVTNGAVNWHSRSSWTVVDYDPIINRMTNHRSYRTMRDVIDGEAQDPPTGIPYIKILWSDGRPRLNGPDWKAIYGD